MNNEMTEKSCARAACGCKAAPGEEYCSLECELAGEGTDCSCGHAECRAQA